MVRRLHPRGAPVVPQNHQIDVLREGRVGRERPVAVVVKHLSGSDASVLPDLVFGENVQQPVPVEIRRVGAPAASVAPVVFQSRFDGRLRAAGEGPPGTISVGRSPVEVGGVLRPRFDARSRAVVHVEVHVSVFVEVCDKAPVRVVVVGVPHHCLGHVIFYVIVVEAVGFFHVRLKTAQRRHVIRQREVHINRNHDGQAVLRFESSVDVAALGGEAVIEEAVVIVAEILERPVPVQIREKGAAEGLGLPHVGPPHRTGEESVPLLLAKPTRGRRLGAGGRVQVGWEDNMYQRKSGGDGRKYFPHTVHN
mmetsp:Transcript_36421/g.71654  ORF Transcript_36421/g.71654 Transcript_36421/m.71654 type:complete len:308 (-) Transcript_36421:82-1005(-)